MALAPWPFLRPAAPDPPTLHMPSQVNQKLSSLIPSRQAPAPQTRADSLFLWTHGSLHLLHSPKPGGLRASPTFITHQVPLIPTPRLAEFFGLFSSSMAPTQLQDAVSAHPGRRDSLPRAFPHSFLPCQPTGHTAPKQASPPPA